MSSNEAIKRIPAAVAGIVKKIEETADAAVSDLAAKGAETIRKIGHVVDVVKKPLIEADALLDELIGGDNGGPLFSAQEVADSVASFPNTIAGVGQDANKSGTATAAASQPSTLGKPTFGITASDIAAKKPE